jgi:fatty-acid desaturase
MWKRNPEVQMKTLSSDRMISDHESDAVMGRVRWVPSKSLWTLAMLVIAVIGAPLTFSWDALALLSVTTAITICAGHSVGMHRLLIHRSFVAPRWLERTLVYLGTLVGMAGPFGMIAAHDIRDWAQRQTDCHDLYAHRKSFWRDCWWQMHCAVELDHPPCFVIEPETANDRFYRFVERSWMLQQLPWAILFFAIGGISWVVWGIALRITLSLHGHWLVGHFAHRRGQQNWAVDGVAVQGYNIPNISLLTFGESWHGNHHAFPGSARLGMAKGEPDPGWWLIRTLELLGLARDVKQPEHVGEREGLYRVDQKSRRYPKKLQLAVAVAAATIVGVIELQALNGFKHQTLSDHAQDAVNVAGIAFAMTSLFGVVTIRQFLTTAEEDAQRSLWFYVSTASVIVLILCALTGPFFFILAPFLLPPAAMAGLAFGIFNKRTIRKHLVATANYPIE